MPPTISRRIAFEILLRVERTAAYAGELLHARLGTSVKSADAALATELTYGVLRWCRLLDLILEPRAGKALDSLDAEVLTALRLGLYQLRFLDRVPAHAAVSESVELVRFARKRSAAGLVNAVLRNLVSSARRPAAELIPGSASEVERLALLHSHPTWLVERWLTRFGPTRTLALLEANNRAPRLTAFAVDPAQRHAVVAEMTAASVTIEPGRWLRDAFAISGANPAALAPFREGRAFIQDEASQMVAHLLDTDHATSILDLCAAPGGKTALLARSSSAGALLVAGDLHPARLRQMRQRLQRAGIGRVEYVALNAARALPFARRFDRVLADVPCSGTGTLARNPEIRWRLDSARLSALHARQVAILRSGLAALAPGGRLVYSTCSLEPEENEEVVREALHGTKEFALISGKEALAPHLLDARDVSELFDDGGIGGECFFRTFPPEHHTDGFFAAVVERKRDATT